MPECPPERPRNAFLQQISSVKSRAQAQVIPHLVKACLCLARILILQSARRAAEAITVGMFYPVKCFRVSSETIRYNVLHKSSSVSAKAVCYVRNMQEKLCSIFRNEMSKYEA